MNYLLKWNQIKWTKVAPFETDAIIYIILFIILSYIINIFNSVSRYVKPKPILYSHTKMVPGGTFWETYVKPKPFEWSQNPYFIPYTKIGPGGTFWGTFCCHGDEKFGAGAVPKGKRNWAESWGRLPRIKQEELVTTRDKKAKDTSCTYIFSSWHHILPQAN